MCAYLANENVWSRCACTFTPFKRLGLLELFLFVVAVVVIATCRDEIGLILIAVIVVIILMVIVSLVACLLVGRVRVVLVVAASQI